MKKIIPALIAFVAPAVAFAQSVPTPPADAEGVLNNIANVLDIAIPIIVTAGVAYFFFGVVKYVTAKDEDKKKEARNTMISGIVGLFIIVSLWGIIALLGSTLSIGQGGEFNAIPAVGR